jgi:hypothetical protein
MSGSAPAKTAPTGDDPAAFLDIVAAAVPPLAAALAAHRQGQLTAARAGYLELIDQPALTALCLHQLGVLLAQAGDNGRAAELISRALRLDGDTPLY